MSELLLTHRKKYTINSRNRKPDFSMNFLQLSCRINGSLLKQPAFKTVRIYNLPPSSQHSCNLIHSGHNCIIKHLVRLTEIIVSHNRTVPQGPVSAASASAHGKIPALAAFFRPIQRRLYKLFPCRRLINFFKSYFV